MTMTDAELNAIAERAAALSQAVGRGRHESTWEKVLGHDLTALVNEVEHYWTLLQELAAVEGLPAEAVELLELGFLKGR
jgi:hypothetical protein